MTEHQTKSIFEIFGEVKREIGPVGKTGYNQRHKYNFRGIDAVVNAIAKAFDDHGVIPAPVLQDKEYSTVEIGKDRTQMGHVLLTVAYRFYGPAGDHFDAVVPGESMDVGDKATSKAMSVAYRTALLQALNLPTGEADPDSDSYERSPRATAQSAGGAFDGATPAKPRREQQPPPDGSEWETAAPAEESRPAEHSGDADDGDWGDWPAAIEAITSQEDAERADADLREVFKGGAMGPTKARNIREAIKAKAASLGGGTPSPNGRHQEEVPA